MKQLAIIGSTGSIGRQTIEVVQKKKEELSITALAVNSDIEELEKQIREFNPKLVCVYDSDKAKSLQDRIWDKKTEVVSGMEGLIACVSDCDVDMVVMALVGMKGILPTMEAIRKRKDIALANKETLVTAGHLIMPLVKEKGIRLLPVDSEHSAIFQSLQGVIGSQIKTASETKEFIKTSDGYQYKNVIEKILLTASGGPFRGKTFQELSSIRPEDAKKHPNWQMGQKITIDSSTLVNKGLEVMEAKWLFDVEPEQIEVLIHPQSILHSAVQFVDGAILGQMGLPDMKLPIQYALLYPNRESMEGKRVDFFSLGQLSFEKPDTKTFRALPLAYEALRRGGNIPTVYNAADEFAVAQFLERKISYLQITEAIEMAMEKIPFIQNPKLEEILSTEEETYHFLQKWIGNKRL